MRVAVRKNVFFVDIEPNDVSQWEERARFTATGGSVAVCYQAQIGHIPASRDIRVLRFVSSNHLPDVYVDVKAFGPFKSKPSGEEVTEMYWKAVSRIVERLGIAAYTDVVASKALSLGEANFRNKVADLLGF